MACIFAKALLARAGECICSRRIARGERMVVDCADPAALSRCRTLMGLLHERMRFALKLPAPGRPLLHHQALRLQCATVAALQDHLCTAHAGQAGPGAPHPGAVHPAATQADVHRLVADAQARHGDLAELPWADLLPALLAWEPRRRRPPAA